jgi:transcriptional regulator with XRE-family HTH domain
MPLSPEDVGARIANARDEKGWSQFDLALAFGRSASTIYRWETAKTGKLPSVSELIRLAEVLDKPSDYLTEPPERQVELSELRQAIQHSCLLKEAGKSVLDSLVSIDVRLSRIEESLGLQDGRTEVV